jgi:hypothetical protein
MKRINTKATQLFIMQIFLPPVTPSLLDPNISLGILFSDTLYVLPFMWKTMLHPHTQNEKVV